MNINQITLAERPKGLPTASNFRMEAVQLSPLNEGEIHVKGLFYSVDPYMRGRMNEAKSYIPPFELQKPITGGVVATVLESKSNEFKQGDCVVGMMPWATESVVSTKGLQKITDHTLPASFYLGILGMPGLTAYFGLLDICHPKSGETVVVSGASGAVGLVVGQIAKIKGCKVVGIAGSDAKVSLLKHEFNFDNAINYKKTNNLTKTIAEVCPNGVDIYFDNVGGEISDAVMNNINFHARIAICGQISLYNEEKKKSLGPRIQPILLVRSVLMKGFIVSNYAKRFPEGVAQLTTWVKEGKLHFKETILEGFEKLPEALLGLFSGENIGKMIVKGGT